MAALVTEGLLDADGVVELARPLGHQLSRLATAQTPQVRSLAPVLADDDPEADLTTGVDLLLAHPAAVCHRHLNPVDANSASMDEPGAGEPPVLSHGAVTLRCPIDAPSATHRRLPGGARWCSVTGEGVLDLLHHVLRTLFVRAGGITGVGVPMAPS